MGDTSTMHKAKTAEEVEQLEREINKASKRKVSLKQVEMEGAMVKDAVGFTNATMDVTEVESEIASALKKKFDEQYMAPWHCIVGRKFGSRVTHESGHFLYMHMGNQAVMLFKARAPEKLH